jgi:hypothetical protein
VWAIFCIYKDRCSGTSKVNAVYSKMPVEQRYMQSRDAKKIVSAIDVRMQARIKWNRQLMQPDTSIGCPNGSQKDRKSNGLRGFSSRETGMMAVPKKRTGA